MRLLQHELLEAKFMIEDKAKETSQLEAQYQYLLTSKEVLEESFNIEAAKIRTERGKLQAEVQEALSGKKAALEAFFSINEVVKSFKLYKASLNSAFERYKDELLRVNRERDQFEQQLKSVSHILEITAMKLQETKNHADALKSQKNVMEIETKLHCVSKDLESSKIELQELHNCFMSLSQEKDGYVTEIRELKFKIQHQEQQELRASELMEEKNNLIQMLETNIGTWKAFICAFLSQAESISISKNALETALQRQRAEYRDLISDRDIKVEQLRLVLHVLNITNSKLQSAEAEAHRLQSKNNHLEKLIDSATTTLNITSKDLDNSRLEFQELQNSFMSLSQEKNSYVEEIRDLTSKLQHQQQQESRMAALLEEKASIIKILETDMGVCKVYICSLLNKTESLSVSNRGLVAALNRHKNEMQILARDRDTKKEQLILLLHILEVINLRFQKVEDESSQLQSQKGLLEKSIDSITAELCMAVADLEKAKLEYQGLNNGFFSLSRERDTLVYELSDLKGKLLDKDEQVTKLVKLLEDKENCMEIIEAEVGSCRADVFSLQEDLSRRKDLEVLLNNANLEIQDLKGLLDEKSHHITIKEQQLQDKTKELGVFDVIVADFESQCSQLKTSLASLELRSQVDLEELELARTEIVSLKKTLNSRQFSIEEQSKELKELYEGLTSLEQALGLTKTIQPDNVPACNVKGETDLMSLSISVATATAFDHISGFKDAFLQLKCKNETLEDNIKLLESRLENELTRINNEMVLISQTTEKEKTEFVGTIQNLEEKLVTKSKDMDEFYKGLASLDAAAGIMDRSNGCKAVFDSLKEKHDNLNHKIKEIETQLTEQHELAASATAQMKASQKQHEEIVIQLTKRQKELSTDLDAALKMLSQKQSCINELTSKIDILSSELIQTKDNLDKETAIKKELTFMQSALEAVVDQKESEVNSLTCNIEDLKAKIEIEVNESNQIRRELADLRSNRQVADSQAQALQCQLESCQALVKDMEEKVNSNKTFKKQVQEKAEKILTMYNEDVAACDQKIQHLASIVHQELHRTEEYKTLEMEREELESRLVTLQNDVQREIAQKIDSQQKYLVLENCLKEKTIQVERLKSEMQDQISKLGNEARALRVEIDIREQEKDAILEESSKALDTIKQVYDAKILTLNEQLSSQACEQIKIHQEEVQRFVQKIHELETEANAARTEALDIMSKKQGLEKQHSEVIDKIRSILETIPDVTHEEPINPVALLESFMTSFNIMSEDLKIKQCLLSANDKKLEELRQLSMESSVNEDSGSKDSVRKLTAELGELRAEKELVEQDLQSKIDFLENEIRNAKFMTAEAKENLQEQIHINKELQNQMASLEMDCQDMFAQLESYEAQIHNVAGKLKESQAKVVQLQDEKSLLEKQLNGPGTSAEISKKLKSVFDKFDEKCKAITSRQMEKESHSDDPISGPEVLTPATQTVFEGFKAAQKSIKKLKTILGVTQNENMKVEVDAPQDPDATVINQSPPPIESPESPSIPSPSILTGVVTYSDANKFGKILSLH